MVLEAHMIEVEGDEVLFGTGRRTRIRWFREEVREARLRWSGRGGTEEEA